MTDIAARFPKNPLLLPKDLHATESGMQIISLINPGVFTYDHKVWMIVRVAQTIIQKKALFMFLCLVRMVKRRISKYL